MHKKYTTWLLWGLITLIPIGGMAWSLIDPNTFEQYQGISRHWALTLGVVAPIIFIFIQAIQVIFAPLSHYVIGAIGGYLYGPYLGGFLNYTGRMIGHIIAFGLARKYGRPLLTKCVDQDFIKKYDRIFGEGTVDGETKRLQPYLLFFVYFLPLFPDDEISYLVGASNMEWKPFFLANFFGQLGGSFSLAYLGSGVDTSDPWFWTLTIGTLLGFPLIFTLLHKSRHTK